MQVVHAYLKNHISRTKIIVLCLPAGDIEGVLDLRPEGLDAAGVEDMVKEYFTKADQVGLC